MGGTDAGAKRKRKREFAALSLDKFAAARQSLAHKQKEKQRKSNARKVNEYKKLVGRLKKEGKFPEGEQGEVRQEEEEEEEASVKNAGADAGSLNKECMLGGSTKHSERDGGVMDGKKSGKRKKAKKDNDISRVDKGNQAKREAQQNAKEEAEKARKKRKEEAEKAARNRNKERSKFRRTNARGQPLMKFQLEKILERLEKEQKK